MAAKLELAVENSRKDIALYEIYKLYVRKDYSPMNYKQWLKTQYEGKNERT